MPYALATSLTSSNYYHAASVPAHYGRARTVDGITIHWWGDPAQHPTFENTVAYLCRAHGNTSAHFVVEDGRVAPIVDPHDAAWHTGSAVGNATTIGIECNPRGSDGDYATIAELIRNLRAQYGDLPLWPHRHWKATACPGTYDLARLDRLARANAPAEPAPIIPTTGDDDMNADQDARLARIEDALTALSQRQSASVGDIVAVPSSRPDGSFDYFAVDELQGTKRAIGPAQFKWMRDLGFRVVEKQAGFTIEHYRLIV
jgi:N-acetylmuramoyl-L-alanine amidase